MENLLSPKQVAAIIGIHIKKVQRLARTGVLPCIKVGSVYRFKESTLEAWIEDKEHALSERKSTPSGEQLGVSLPRRRGRPKAEKLEFGPVPVRGVCEGGFTTANILPE